QTPPIARTFDSFRRVTEPASPTSPKTHPEEVAMSEATAPGVTMEHAVARLYSARVIDKNAVSKAVVKFKLNPQSLAKELGHDSVAELAAELVTEASAGNTETWTPFSFEEAVRVLYTDRDKKPAQLSLEMPART